MISVYWIFSKTRKNRVTIFICLFLFFFSTEKFQLLGLEDLMCTFRFVWIKSLTFFFTKNAEYIFDAIAICIVQKNYSRKW